MAHLLDHIIGKPVNNVVLAEDPSRERIGIFLPVLEDTKNNNSYLPISKNTEKLLFKEINGIKINVYTTLLSFPANTYVSNGENSTEEFFVKIPDEEFKLLQIVRDEEILKANGATQLVTPLLTELAFNKGADKGKADCAFIFRLAGNSTTEKGLPLVIRTFFFNSPTLTDYYVATEGTKIAKIFFCPVLENRSLNSPNIWDAVAIDKVDKNFRPFKVTEWCIHPSNRTKYFK